MRFANGNLTKENHATKMMKKRKTKLPKYVMERCQLKLVEMCSAQNQLPYPGQPCLSVALMPNPSDSLNIFWPSSNIFDCF